MKKSIIIITLWVISLSVFAQVNISLIFTGQQINDDPQTLDSIRIINKTQGWSETLYYPDTTLRLKTTIGISKYSDESTNHIKLYQNTPNPFSGTTDFRLTLYDKEKVSLKLFDLNGKRVAEYNNTLSRGEHTFRATVSTPQTYLLSAVSNSGTSAIKMINLCNHGHQCHIEHTGSLPIVADIIKKESQKASVTGDEMIYVGYTTQKSKGVIDSVKSILKGSENIIFTFPEILPTTSFTLYTQPATEISYYKATLNANYDYQHTTVVRCGFRYRKNGTGNYITAYTTQSSTPYQLTITGLEANTTYKFRAIANNRGIQKFGSQELTFTTLAVNEPASITDDVTDITYNSATLHGSYVSPEESQVSEVGFEYRITRKSWISQAVTPKTKNYCLTLNSLTASKTYQYRAYAKLSSGTKIYGATKDFTTMVDKDSRTQIETLNADTKSSNNAKATLYGHVISDGRLDIMEAGFYWGTDKSPVTTGTKVVVSDCINNYNFTTDSLTRGTTYYYVAYLKNNQATYYGEVKSFTLAPLTLPQVYTRTYSNVGTDKADVISKVLDFGGSNNVTFGVVFSDTNNEPTLSDLSVNTELTEADSTYLVHIFPLKKGTRYYARAYAKNEMGTSYGNVITLTSSNTGYACGDTIQDKEGNEYTTVAIGKQCWMAEDLRTKTLPNGEKMQTLTTNADYASGRYYYEIPSTDTIAGGSILYPWSTACNSQSNMYQEARLQGICPEGWVIPTYKDVADLCRAIDPDWNDGGESYQPDNTDNNPCKSSNNHLAVKLASPDGHWYFYSTGNEYSTPDLSYNQTPNTPGYYQPDFAHKDFNASGFNAIPKGYWSEGQFSFDGSFSFWTAISNSNTGYGNFVKVALNKSGIEHVSTESSAKNGYSVRCLKASYSNSIKYSKYDNYKGEAIPDFNTLGKPTTIGYIDCMELECVPGNVDDNYAILFEYDLNVEKKDTYTFRLASHDKAQLLIDSNLLIQPGKTCSYATVVLAPGRHYIRVEYCEATGYQMMNLAYKTANTTYQTVGNRQPEGIPDFVEYQAKETLKRLNEWKGTDKVIVFPILTDIHTDARETYKHYGYTVAMDKYFNYDFMACLGDIGLNSLCSKTDRKYSLEVLRNTLQGMKKYKGVFLYTPGNHDWDGGESTFFTASELSAKFQQPFMQYANGNLHIEPGNVYGYYDIPQKNMRCIFLNSEIEEPTASKSNYYSFGHNQLHWLSTLLQNTPKGTHVLILTHWMPDSVGRLKNEKNTIIDTTTTNALLSMMEAYYHKTKGGRNGISWDFSQSNGSLIGVITGDSHFCALAKTNDVNYMVIEGIVNGHNAVNPSYLTDKQKIAPLDPFKSMSIDIIAIKPNTKEVHSFRVGSGGERMDMQFTY